MVCYGSWKLYVVPITKTDVALQVEWMESGANKSELGETAKIGLEVSAIGGDACRCCPEFQRRRHAGVMSLVALFCPLSLLAALLYCLLPSLSQLSLCCYLLLKWNTQPQFRTFFLNHQSTSYSYVFNIFSIHYSDFWKEWEDGKTFMFTHKTCPNG